MPNTKDYRIGTIFQAMVYGGTGVGKSFGAMTFPRPNVIDFDNGIAVARHPEFVKKYGIRSIEYETFTEKGSQQKGVILTHNAFDDACRYFDTWMAAGKRDQFDTWIVDSGTTLSQAALNKAIILLGGGGFSGVKSSTHDEAKRTGLVFPKIQDYGSERSLVEQFIDMVKSSGKHFVFICHEKEVSDKDGNLMQVVPLLTGKGATSVALKFDEVYRVYVKRRGPDVMRVVQTESDFLRMARSRYGIPNDTDWNWDSVNAALGKIRSSQADNLSPQGAQSNAAHSA